MTIEKLAFIVVIFAATFMTWEAANQPLDEPTWRGAIRGFAYSPMQPGKSPQAQQFPTEAEIAADLAIIAEHSTAIRTYSLDGTLAEIPRIAATLGLFVTAGIWLDGDRTANQARIAQLKRAVANNSNIQRVIVGNETLLTEALTVAELAAYLTMLRDELSVPVGTAEPWHIWLANPELAEFVDFAAVHHLPYWEGVPVAAAVRLVDARMEQLESVLTDTPILIGEVGWPSNGRMRNVAGASRKDAEIFLRRFLSSAEEFGYDYYLMEAFDQPWKRIDEGEVGAYWGLFDGRRQAKYALAEDLVAFPNARWLALIAASLATLVFFGLTAGAHSMRKAGTALLASASLIVANAVVWSMNDYLDQYWTFGSVLAAIVLLSGILAMILLIFVEVHEWAEARYAPRLRAVSTPSNAARQNWPKVSIHVPTYEEPPAMVAATLEALAQLDYPNFEVLVIDNNTRDETMWRPVQACCKRLGDQFRFFHVAPLSGFKAGALNYALSRTAHDTDIIAVIDSDYCVKPDWLKRLVPHFGGAKTALVQAPQDYRDHHSQIFKRFCEAEYRGFFSLGMVTRNERNAIIQHGTMTLIRASALREVGAWAEWTITEDAELGLRMLEHGYDSVYVAESFGQGLTPDRFRDYRSQRYRWALGATQILRQHGKKLLGLEASALTLGQRFHFLTGWAAWLGDGLNLIFNLIAIGWSALMYFRPQEFLPPVAMFSSFVLALFFFKLIKMASLYVGEVRASVFETLAAIVSGLSLVFVTGRAVLAGVVGSHARFVRTPKLANKDNLLGALAAVASEAFLALTLLICAAATYLNAPYGVDRNTWCALLVIFALPHIAAVSLSVLSALPGRRFVHVATQLKESVSNARQT